MERLIKTPDTSDLVTTTVLNTKISEVEKKSPNTSSLVTIAILNTEISEVENERPDNSRYITTQEFNKVTAENFAARLTQANLVSKNYFDNKLTSFNKQIASNKTNHSEVPKKLNSVITKDHKFFLGRIYFASNDQSQNTFVYQPTFDTT